MNWDNVTLAQAKQIFIMQSETGHTDAYLYSQFGKILGLDKTDSTKAKKEIDELLDSDISNEITDYTFCDGRYGFQYDFASGMWWGQYLGIEMSCENVDNIWYNIEQILAVIIRPIVKPEIVKPSFSDKIKSLSKRERKIKELESNLLNNQYKIEDYDIMQRDRTAIDLLTVPYSKIRPVVFFCLRIGEEYTISSITTLQEK